MAGHRSPRLLATTVVAALSMAPAASAAPIGTPEWTVQQAVGQPPEAERRVLEPGLPVVYREAVATDAAGAADFIFNNSARLLVGPECSLTLDERFYDPELDVDVVSASVATDTFCVSRIDQVRALRALGERPADVASGSAAQRLGEDFSGEVDRGTPITLIRTASADIVVAGGSALIGVEPGRDGARIVKTSPDGLIFVRTPTEQAILRRGGFDVQVTADGRILGPNRTSMATLKLLHGRLGGSAGTASPPDLPYVMDPVVTLPRDPLGPLGRFPTEPPDHCQLTDTCLGLERVVVIDDDDALETEGGGDEVQ